MKSLFTFFSILSFTFCVFGQSKSTHYWTEFEPTQRLTADQVALTQKAALGLRLQEALVKKNKETDALGYSHHRYQQTYKDIPIEGAIYLLHEQYGMAKLGNGNLVRGIQADATPVLTEAQALEAALASVNAQQYAWQDDNMEKAIKMTKNDATASFYPQGELVWIAANIATHVKAADYHLAYKFDVYATQPMGREYIYINAKTGDMISKVNRLCDVDTPCSASVNYATSCDSPVVPNAVDITVDDMGTFYRLQETGRGGGIHTYTSLNVNSYPIFDITATSCPFDTDPTGTEIHWGTEQTFDYFLSEHGRSSFNGNNALIMSWAHYGTNYDNAFWNGSWLTYGDGGGGLFNALSALDVVGHEFAHGVTDYSANLIYSYESGALNESFSDIFGVAIEFYADPACGDWLIGEDIMAVAGKTCLRNMANPNDVTALTQQPDTYLGDFWYTGSGDNGGVHYNSGVQNYWFHLLSEGGSGTNDNGDAYAVTGIGIGAAAKIAYRNLTTYLTPSAQYVDARNGAIQAATDLFGMGSNEVQQVVNAWCAVGVGACSITSSSITITTPNGGEIWQQGMVQNITWTDTGGISDVLIEYSIDNGANWIYVATVPNVNTFAWIIPNNPTSLALVRVKDATNPVTYDVSDANFTLQGCNVIAGFTTSTVTFCVDENITFVNTSNGATTYEWKINGTTYSTANNFTHTFTQAGTYTLVLEASNGFCTDNYSMTMIVLPATSAAFTQTINELQANFVAAEMSALSYDWTIDGTGIGTGATLSHTFGTSGTYTVCLSLVTDCGEAAYCASVTVVETNPCGIGMETWTQYTNGESIRCTVEDGDYLWVATSGGLSKVNQIDGTVTFFNTANSDLPHNIVTSILKTSNNEFFVGTDRGGLAKFDGVSATGWTIYNTTNSDLPSNTVLLLLENSMGEIIISNFSGGLVKFDGISATGWTTYSGLPDLWGTALLEDSNGDLFVGTGDGGIAKYIGGATTSPTIYNATNSELPVDGILSLLESSSGDILVGTSGGGLAKFDGTSTTGWTIYDTANSGLSNNTIQHLAENTNGDIFAGTYGSGLAKFDGVNWTNYYYGSNYITALIVNSNDEVVVGTGTNSNFGKFDGINTTSWINYNIANSDSPFSQIAGSLKSSNGDMFINTNRGVAIFDGFSAYGWTVYPQYHANQEGLAQNSQGDVFVGAWTHGVVKFDGTNTAIQTTFSTTNSDLPDNTIRTIMASSNDDIFVGTATEGLAKFDGTSATGWTIFNTTNSDLPENGVHALLESSTGDIFVGTGDGLAKFDGTSATGWTIFNTTNSDLPNDYIYDILENSNGEIFIGTGDGLAKFDGASTTGWVTFTSANSEIPWGGIKDLLERDNGDILVATGGGLAIFDGTSPTGWTIYNELDSGLPDYNVRTLAAVTDDDILVGTGNGLAVLHFGASSTITASFTTTPTNCANQTINFTNTSTGATTYEWFIDGISVATTTDLDHTFPTPGTYTVTLTATNGDCTDTYEQAITIHSSVLNFDLGNDLLTCNNSITIDSGIPDALYYFWDFEGMLIGTDPTLTVTQSGFYTLSVGDFCGNAALDSIYVEIDDDCVWPGDFNYDNIVNNYDLLAWGLTFGSTGTTRPNASFNWEAQAGIDWSDTQANGANYKHCDGDGDGIVGANDPIAIGLNYGQTHGPLPLAPAPSISPFVITPVAGTPPTSFGNSTTIAVELHLDNIANPTVTAYGLAFAVNYVIPDAVNIHDAYIVFNDSWLGTENVNMQTIQKHFPTSAIGGQIQVGMSRIDHQNANGSGPVAILIAEIDLVTSMSAITMNAEVGNIQLMMSNGNLIPVGATNNPLTITANESFEPILQPKVFLEGAYNTTSGTMQTALYDNGLLPLTQPFDISPWNYNQNTSVATLTDMPPNVVDWVLVELRSADNVFHSLKRRAALLLDDGSIVDVNHTDGLHFPTVADNTDYYLVVRHRNHLAVITAEPVSFNSTDPTVVDFTQPNTVMGGTGQLIQLADGNHALAAGDFNSDGIISIIDFNFYGTQSSALNDYNDADANLDKNVTIADFNAYLPNSSRIGVEPIRY